MEYAVGLALIHLVRPNLINEVVDHVAEVQRVQHPEAEINRELQPGLTRRRFDSFAVLEQQHPKTIEASILQREAILSLIHP